jgi:hypothetical protein
MAAGIQHVQATQLFELQISGTRGISTLRNKNWQNANSKCGTSSGGRSRGEIVDTSALLTALNEGYLAGAALDVTDPDPLPPNSPLLKLDNIILTGHSAHFSPENWIVRLERPAEEIARVMRREWPVGLINPEVKEKHIQKWGTYYTHDT